MVASNKSIKLVLLVLFSLLFLVWAMHGLERGDAASSAVEEVTLPPGASPDDYVGSEACQACHEDQSKGFTPTKHAKLGQIASWKNKAQGCESCHGPGRLHLEDATNPKGIISFRNKNSKQISETCLACHAGKEAHNNYRRGEHWRADVGCTDCHSSHGSPMPDSRPGSIALVGQATNQNPGVANTAMLRQNEPQLCLACHTETKAQFTKPFHHKVLEGAMNCSSCHNAHGGFEAKQTKLAVGADISCIGCHSNRQGPFVFEHAPLKTEGCMACHTPHGTSNPKLLNRSSARQLCMECHSTITAQVVPGTPSFHDQANVRWKDCTVCHAAIHGSNAHKAFFR